MQEGEPFFSVEGFGFDPYVSEIGKNRRFDAFQSAFGVLDGRCINAKGDVLGLDETVVALGGLGLEHVAIFFANGIELIILFGDRNGVSEFVSTDRYVKERKLKVNGIVEEIEKLAPSIENGGLVVIVGKLIADVLELNRL